MIVADSGPLITFARARKLDLIRQIVKTLVIPEGGIMKRVRSTHLTKFKIVIFFVWYRIGVKT